MIHILSTCLQLGRLGLGTGIFSGICKSVSSNPHTVEFVLGQDKRISFHMSRIVEVTSCEILLSA